MLTRLEVDGFKSFENLDIDLAPFTVIVGNNAAGKSNLFDAIQLLSNLATHDVGEAVKDMRGEPLELFRQTAAGHAQQIRMAAEVLVDPMVRDPWGSEVTLTHTRMRHEITLERRELKPGIERIQVARELRIQSCARTTAGPGPSAQPRLFATRICVTRARSHGSPPTTSQRG